MTTSRRVKTAIRFVAAVLVTIIFLFPIYWLTIIIFAYHK